MGFLNVSEFGRVTKWYDTTRAAVLFRESDQNNKRRGGCFAAAPIFGATPKDVPWKLPQHGPVRSLGGISGRQHLISQKINSSGGYWEYRFVFPTSRDFPWSYFVFLSLEYNRPEEKLAQTMRIVRAADCQNNESMPVSGGFHPYFATAGEPFVIHQQDEVFCDHTAAFHQSLRLSHEGGDVILERQDTIVTISCTGHFDQFNLWTDAPEKYVCVEPIGGRATPLRLRQREEFFGACIITVHRN